MKDELIFIENKKESTGRNLFTHWNLPESSNGRVYLFFNPLFDEKKRVQKFQSETARKLSKSSLSLRFDYYGTGDSAGELFDFDFEESLSDVTFLSQYIFQNYKNVKEIIPVGIRMGSDLAILFAQQNDFIKKLILIEPIINGKRYLIEQRARKMFFMKLNNMTLPDPELVIDGQHYEDFQGYPLSQDCINFLENWNEDSISLKNKDIIMIKLNCITSQKQIHILKKKLTFSNVIEYIEIPCNEFWSSLEPVDTSELTKAILSLDK